MIRLRFSILALMTSAALLVGCGTSDGGVRFDLPDGSVCNDTGDICRLPDGGLVYSDGGVIPDGGLPDGSVVPLPPLAIAICPGQTEPYACGNLIDDDGDGQIDSRDSDCLGPCDDNEGGFDPLTSTSMGGNDCKVDCYFDPEAGGGNGCSVDITCDPLEPGVVWGNGSSCGFDPPCSPDPYTAAFGDPGAQNQNCADDCGPMVPNGCDCFGCCLFDSEIGKIDGSDLGYRFIGTRDASGATCTSDAIGSATACRPCTPVPSCQNGCGRCELCLGRDLVNNPIPADCLIPSDAGVDDQQCPDPTDACGLPGQAACAGGEYCLTGCCTGFIVE